MLRFAVYDDDGPARRWPLDHAHLVGPADLSVPGRVQFRQGVIHCQKRGSQAVGLCLQHDAGDMGRLMLQTSLLPDRKKPYILTVELARHRIKMFIAKSEEWQLFDLGADHPAMVRWEEARRIFTRAITTESGRKADRLGRRSLRRALEAAELLATAHAEILLHRRYGHRAASSVTLGVRIWPGRDSKALRDLVESDFDVVMVPLRWRELEVEEGKYNWDPLDRWIDWAAAQGKPIVTGPLLDFSKAALPEWMYVWQHDYDTCRDLAYDYVERIVRRYRSVVGMWNLASGVNVNDNFTFAPEQMFDLVRMAAQLVRHAHKGARTMIELKQPFGEHCAQDRKSMPPATFLERLLHEGVRLDAVGVQLLFGTGGLGRAARDIMQISSMLDEYFLLEIPVLISAMGVPSALVDEAGGYWRGPWSAAIQSKWVARLFSIAMSKPFVESVFWADLVDHRDADLPHSGLIDADGQAKPALARLLGMRRRLRKPLGPMRATEKSITQDEE